MPTPRLYFGMAVYQNKIYVIGGRNDITYSVNEVYDPSNDTWETKQSMPIGGSDLDANVVNGRIYLIWQNHNEVYGVQNDSWSSGRAMPYPVIAYASSVFDDKIYIFGGLGSGNSCGGQTQIYDPVLDSWSIGAPSPTAIYNAAAGATSGEIAPKAIYVIGGNIDPLVGSDLNQVYCPENNSWASGAPMPTARSGLTVAVVNDTLYAIGGFENIYLSTGANEQYTSIGYGTIPPTVSITSPASTVFNETEVPLTFTFDRPCPWIGYSLDGQDNITITGNATLTGLPNGVHNVTVYANDTFGNVASSQLVNFTVDYIVTHVSYPTPFPTTSIVATSSVIAVAIASVGIFYHFKKPNNQNKEVTSSNCPS